MPARVKLRDAQADVHEAMVIWSLAKLYPVSARAPLSETQPMLVQPGGTCWLGRVGGLEVNIKVRRLGPPQISWSVYHLSHWMLNRHVASVPLPVQWFEHSFQVTVVFDAPFLSSLSQ